MKPTALLPAALLALAPSAHADTFGSGANTFTIDFVTVGNAGNGDDRALDANEDTPDPNDDEYASPYGGVGYEYRIGVTEVPQDWIDKATNLGMSNVTAGAFMGNRPASNMTWYEAAAFVNWLNTSTGHQPAYRLDSASTELALWTATQAWQSGGENLFRNKDAYYFLPSEDEWYKAAYHKNDGVTANYWDYPTGSNSTPIAVTSGTADGTAVYDYFNGGAGLPATVDNNGGLSPYGTRGQGGNVREWTESAADGVNDSGSESRTSRGGPWTNTEAPLRAYFRYNNDPSFSINLVGFRVATIPEPGSVALLAAAAFPLLLRRRR